MFYVVLAKLWPVIGRATQVAKKEVFYWFPFGLACWLWGTLFINRENNSAQTAINKQSKAITERNVWKCNWNSNLIIFFQYFYDFVCSRKFCSSLRELETHQVIFLFTLGFHWNFNELFQSPDVLLPFKKGSFHLAVQAQCPVQPIVVSRYTFLDSKAKIFGRGHSIIKILPMVETKGLTKDDVDSLTLKVQAIMQENFEKLNDEVAATISMKF